MTKEDFILKQENQILSPWVQYFIRFNPTNILKKVTCPVLAVNGSKDLQGNYPVAFTFGISTILLMASKTGCPFLIAVSTMERSMANSC